VSIVGHFLGLDSASGPWYLWWSGFAGDITLILGGLALLRKHNCHVKRCHRLARFPVSGSEFFVCSRHHPTGAPSASDIREG